MEAARASPESHILLLLLNSTGQSKSQATPDSREKGSRLELLMGVACKSLPRCMLTRIVKICGHILQSPTERCQRLLSVNYIPGIV